MEQPEGWKDNTNRVWKLNKALEGLHQAGKAWYETLTETLKSLGFIKVISLPSVHIYQKDDVKVIVPVYVDDKLLLCNSRKFADKLVTDLKMKHNLRHLGPAKSILGMKIVRDRAAKTISLSSPSYIDKIVNAFQMSDSNLVTTPMTPGLSLSKEDGPKNDDESVIICNKVMI